MLVATQKRLIVVSLAMALLAGCSADSKYADLDKYMVEVQAREKPAIEPLPTFEPYQAFAYGAQALRSPFVPPLILPPDVEAERIANIGVTPPQNHVKQFLERFSLASLSMVGTMSRESEIWALIKDSDGGVHMVQIGDYLGANYGKVESIDDNRVDITEIVSDSHGGWLRRPRSIIMTQSSDG